MHSVLLSVTTLSYFRIDGSSGTMGESFDIGLAHSNATVITGGCLNRSVGVEMG
jgi:hypothetical protein